VGAVVAAADGPGVGGAGEALPAGPLAAPPADGVLLGEGVVVVGAGLASGLGAGEALAAALGAAVGLGAGEALAAALGTAVGLGRGVGVGRGVKTPPEPNRTA